MFKAYWSERLSYVKRFPFCTASVSISQLLLEMVDTALLVVTGPDCVRSFWVCRGQFILPDIHCDLDEELLSVLSNQKIYDVK